jgi:lysophospholipase L1-like esterase
MNRPPGIVSFGHSWVFGTGATARTNGFVGRLTRATGSPINNRSVSGSTAGEVAAVVEASTLGHLDAVLIMTGLNDARLRGASVDGIHHYERALDRIVRAFTKFSPDARILAIAQPPLLDYTLHAPFNRGSDAAIEAYNAALARGMAEAPHARVITVEGWNPVSMLAADTVHPNDKGHALIAHTLEPILLEQSQSAPPTHQEPPGSEKEHC